MIKVMIADDETAVLSSTKAVLEVFGFEVVTVSNAGEILARLRAERPAVLLQDVRMPGLDLRTHLRAIRTDPEIGSLPVLVFTANVDAEEVWRSVGADGVVEKPFDPRALRDTLHQIARG